MSEQRDLQFLLLSQLLARTVRDHEQEVAELRAESELARVTLASIGDGVLATDAEARVRYLNPVAEELCGWRLAEARGRTFAEVLKLVDVLGGDTVHLDLDRCLVAGKTLFLTDSLTLRSRDGRQLHIEGSAAPIRGLDQEVTGLVLTFHDVDDRQVRSPQQARAANYDGLTGLLNREAFDRHLRTALEDCQSRGESQVLLHMDLAQLKVVNDTCGHAAGDLMLQWIASLIRERVSDTDVLARLGGNEFGLLLPRYPLSAAQRVADELHEALRNFRFIWQDKNFVVSMSIGLVVLAPEFRDLGDLLRAADQACELAKAKGRGRTQVYHSDDAEIRQLHGQTNWVVKTQEALDEDRFVLYWQRILPISQPGPRPLFYEVLVRMKGSDGKIHPPGEFMPAAERYGLMPAIDRWVVRHTLERLGDQPRQFLDQLDCCSINLSGASLGDGSVGEFIARELQRTGFPAERICFEITETAAVSNLARAARMIEQLSDLRCRWALDDFGSGMSSFRYLRELPVDFLKIDGNIVKDVLANRLNRAMVQSIHQIGQVMDIRTIAEHVTSEAMFRALGEIGVDFAQGFWIERPRPLERPAKPPAAGPAVLSAP